MLVTCSFKWLLLRPDLPPHAGCTRRLDPFVESCKIGKFSTIIRERSHEPEMMYVSYHSFVEGGTKGC